MRLRAIFGVCLGLLLLTAGCDPLAENRLFREGIGTDLSRQELAQATQAQDVYLGFICQQAGLGVVRSGDAVRCSDDGIGSRNWSLIVQAGMNDIDQRCDAYLAWLDDRRRSRSPILSEISAIQTATISIMRFTGASPNPISIAGQAFGLTSSTFTNLNSRLLLEVNHSTVQAVVMNRRNGYRLSIADLKISNRPAAIHALRSYLNICMPFTIEMDINTTVTAFQFGGAEALIRPPANSPDTIRASIVAVTPRQAISQTKRAQTAPSEDLAKVFDNYNAAVHTPSYLKRIQDSLCAPIDGKAGPVTLGLINIFEAAYRPSGPTRRNGKLDADEIDEILEQGSCKKSAWRNYFERRTFTDDETGTQALSGIITNLKKYDAGKSLAPSSSPTKELRAAIRGVRNDPKIKSKLRAVPDVLSDQITDDLFSVLMGTP